MAENNKKRACEAEREYVLRKGNQLRPEGERGQGPGMLHHLNSRKRKEQQKRLGKSKEDIQESEMTRESKRECFKESTVSNPANSDETMEGEYP